MQRRQALKRCTACWIGISSAVRGQSAPAATQGSLPLQLLRTGDIGALPAVEILLDGRVTRWLVDSGATTSLVTPFLAQALALERLSPVRVATAGGLQTLERYTLPALPGGGRSALTAVAMDLDSVLGVAGASLDGLLGAPWLRERTSRFDFAGRALRWSATAPPAAAHACVLPLRWDDGLPVLQMSLGARAPEDFLLDTGNAGALVVFAQRAHSLLTEVGPLPETTVDELGGRVRARHARVERLSAAGLVAREVPAALESGPAARRGGHFERLAGSLGVALFEAGAITLDGPGARLLVELPGLPDPPALPGGFGLRLGRPAGTLIATAVIGGSPAAVAGIAAGDALVGIDGVDVRAWSPAQAWLALVGLDRAIFDLARGDAAPRRVPLQRARFFPLLR